MFLFLVGWDIFGELPRRSQRQGPQQRAEPVAERQVFGCGCNHCLRYGHRQAQRSLRRALLSAQKHRRLVKTSVGFFF